MTNRFLTLGVMIAISLAGWAEGSAAPPGMVNAAWQNAYGQYRTPLSADDQRKFDDYYHKWMDAIHKNDSDDIQANAKHMQDIMAHYNIAPDVPFDHIASNLNRGYAYQGNSAYANQPSGHPAYEQSRLPADDQDKFDRYYRKWVNARRKNDRDDIDKNARHMQDIMTHYNIPANVPFDQIASAAANH